MASSIMAATISGSGAYFTDRVEIKGNQVSVFDNNIVINEVYYDTGHLAYNNGAKVEEEGKNEWIELYNGNDFPVNIKNWNLVDNSNTNHPINANVSIPAKGFALLSHDNTTWNFWGDPSGANIVKTNLGGSPGSGWLANTGDRLFLKNATGDIVDSLSWGSDKTVFDPSCPDIPEGHSLERNPTGKDTDSPSDFIERITPTPGS